MAWITERKGMKWSGLRGQRKGKEEDQADGARNREKTDPPNCTDLTSSDGKSLSWLFAILSIMCNITFNRIGFVSMICGD
jgi:hypothetical protein